MPRAARVPALSNRLLGRLPAKDRERLIAGSEEVKLASGEILAAPGEPVRNVYFPVGSVISLILPMDRKSSLEVALVGSEGVYGVSVALGVGISPLHAVVQGAGLARQMGAVAFRRELGRVSALRECVERYTFVLISQLIQNAGCNRFHLVEQRVARWLLMTGDRAHCETFDITHESLAAMLGVRRVGVTRAASALQGHGLISYTRGVLTILDRKGLERASCTCYRSDLSAYQRAFASRYVGSPLRS
jgi:CRP-like cAMP-binding protein